jgi:O-antigen/teichoic acid export membrane protein
MTALLRNATWSGAATAVRAASGLANALLAVRLLGAEGYGHVATMLSLFVLYLSLNSSVFTILVSRLMAPDASGGDGRPVLLAAASQFAVISMLLLAVATIALGQLAAAVLRGGDSGGVFDGDRGRAILAMGMLTGFQIAVALHSAIIESAGRLDVAMKAQLAGPVVVLATLAASLAAGVRVSASGYVVALCLGAIADLSLLRLVKRSVSPARVPLRPSRESWRRLLELLRSGGLLQAASLMNLFLEPLNKMLLNFFAGAHAVTAYDLAMKVIWGIQSLFGAAMRVFLHLSGENGALVARAFSRAIALVGVPVIACHAAGAIFLGWVAHHWMAIDATLLMAFFAIATVSNLGMIYIAPLYINLIGRGDLGFVFRSQAILAVTNLVVSLALIPPFGLIGAAFGLLCATLYNVVAIYLRHRKVAGALEGIGGTVSAIAKRYALTVLLFAAAIFLGMEGPASLPLQSGMLVVLGAIVMREPLVWTLWERVGRRR